MHRCSDASCVYWSSQKSSIRQKLDQKHRPQAQVLRSDVSRICHALQKSKNDFISSLKVFKNACADFDESFLHDLFVGCAHQECKKYQFRTFIVPKNMLLTLAVWLFDRQSFKTADWCCLNSQNSLVLSSNCQRALDENVGYNFRYRSRW